jgi:multisubunit Na+/H+ antiporter MnhG subunit
MRNPAAIIFLVLFAMTTLLTYLSVRRRWLSLSASTILGITSASLCFVLFMFSQNGNLLQALVFGTLIGTVFSVLTVSAAGYFRANAAKPSALPELREQPPADQ